MYTSRVLIVDDQALMRNHMYRLLKEEGYELHFAENGLEALDKIYQLRPDLVLLDVRIPGIDGFEVCERTRSNPPTADIPIIMVTAFDDRKARLRGIEVGADDFIPKPYDTLELKARVRTITRLNRYRRLLVEKSKFRLIADLAQNGYMLITKDGRCTFANHQARLYLGLPIDMETELDVPFVEMAEQRYRCESEKAWENWPDRPPDNESRYLVRPESKRLPALWLQVQILDKLVSESQVVWMVSLKDVSQQMSAKQDMWKFQRAIHHKMRTPLIGMYSGIQFLANFHNDLPEAEVSELLQTALKHGQRLKHIVEDVLRYVDSPNFAKNGGGFVLANFEEKVYQLIESLEVKRVALPNVNGLGTTKLVLSDESMEVILWELLENSKKFHPEQDPLISFQIDKLDDLNAIKIVIRDNGTCLTPEQLKYLWHPYYQSEKSFTGEVEGMGLGLATVASVLWSVGGRLNVQNRADGEDGVEATLLLPIA